VTRETRHTGGTVLSLIHWYMGLERYCCHSQIHPFFSGVVVEAWGIRKCSQFADQHYLKTRCLCCLNVFSWQIQTYSYRAQLQGSHHMTQSEYNFPCISLNTPHHTADCFKWWTASLIYILHKLLFSVTASFVTLDKGLFLPDVKLGSQFDTAPKWNY
jgi:DNA-directed RNA polymerase subunit N (RpoN/RPB10)